MPDVRPDPKPERKKGNRPRRIIDHGAVAPEALAYYAGLFDGEGTFRWPGSTRGLRVQLKLEISDEAVVLDMLRDLGGTTSRPRHDKRETVSGRPRATMYYWYVSACDEVEGVLRTLLPYLRVKRASAERALAILEERLAA